MDNSPAFQYNNAIPSFDISGDLARRLKTEVGSQETEEWERKVMTSTKEIVRRSQKSGAEVWQSTSEVMK